MINGTVNALGREHVLKFASWNVRSLNVADNRVQLLKVFFSRNLDLIALSETHLTSSGTSVMEDTTLEAGSTPSPNRPDMTRLSGNSSEGPFDQGLTKESSALCNNLVVTNSFPSRKLSRNKRRTGRFSVNSRGGLKTVDPTVPRNPAAGERSRDAATRDSVATITFDNP